MTSSYSPASRFLHWLTVFLLALQFAIAWLMPEIHRGTKPIGLISWHLSVGTLIILVVVARAVVRLTGPRIARLPGLPRHIEVAAKVVHGLLYLLLLVVPLLGWANASSRGWAVSLFLVIPLPQLVPTGSALGHALGDVHQVASWLLLATVAMHVLAALYHHFILRDNTLRRMLPSSSGLD
ncbi:MAG: cytochrome b [Burkholderiales bacterium]|nr:cytochrome b [Burkholderiales bacterium]